MKSFNKRYLNLAPLLILILSSCSGNNTAGLYFQSEQNEIVNRLDRICVKLDKIIEYRKQIIEKLEEYKKCLIYECVTGKKEVN